MNKKSSISNLEIGTPKATTRINRTLSQTSSSGSSKAKVSAKMPSNGKQNFSSNVQDSEDKFKTTQNINPVKGLKRIKEKALGETKLVMEKQASKFPDKGKLFPRQVEKVSQSHSNKSLLSNKIVKQPLIQHSDKKSPLSSEKSTPKNLQKQTSLLKMDVKKAKPLQLNQSRRGQIQYCANTIKGDERQSLEKMNQRKQAKRLMISMFEIRKKLTEGAFSTTFEVVHIQTGLFYCLKVFQKAKIKQQGLEQQIVSELEFRRKVSNQHMQKIFAVFDDEVYIYFVEEYVIGFGVLEKQLHAKRKLTEKQSGNIFKQVFDIVRCIHSESYIHRDIRLQNLVRCFGMIKLIDFSWIACLRYKKERDTFCGAYKYAPPQLLEGDNYDESIDIWSLGILLYELTTGQSPFNDGFVRRNSHSMNFPIFLSNQLVDLIGRLLSDKGVRMRIQEILMHEWTNKWEIDGFVCKEIWDFWVL